MNNETISSSYRDQSSYQNSWIYKGMKKTREILRDTPVEGFLVGIASTACAIALSYNHEVDRSHKVPLAFSEITQLEKQAKAEGKEVGAMSEYYSKVSDVTMKTLEAYNNSWQNGNRDNSKSFAKELAERMTKDSDYGAVHTYTIKDLLDQMPALAENATKTMSNYVQNLSLIKSLNHELDASWTESHIDDYRTEIYMDIETHTDSKGNSYTTTVPRVRQVYDHTTHSYDYHPENGELASSLLAELKNNKEALSWPENLCKVKQINQPNQDAIIFSRTRGEEVPKLSKIEILDVVNAWNRGSTYNQNKGKMTSCVENIPSSEKIWRSAKSNAKSTSYITYSTSDSGPQEYQRVKEILGQTKNLEQGINEILAGINQVNSQAPILKKSIEDYVSTLNGTTIDPKEAQKAIMGTVQSWYSSNIKGGFDTNMFRWHCILLWGLLGATIGGLAGAGLDQMGKRFDWYGDKEKDFIGRQRKYHKEY